MSESRPRAVVPLERPPDATVPIPGSKSITNRALLVAAMATVRTRLQGALLSDDTEAMVGCLTALGIEVSVDAARRTIELAGTGGRVPSGPVSLNVRQSGTTARFMAALVGAGKGTYSIDGHPQMRRRPMGDLADALGQLGVKVSSDGDAGQLPLCIVGNRDAGGMASVPGDVSSQFLSGLLLAAPLYRHGYEVEVTTELVSKPYVDLTIAVMAAFGVDVQRDGYRSFAVRDAGYCGRDYTIEPDASAASYFFAAAAICGGRVRIDGLGRRTLQGDLRFVELLARMGADVRVEDEATEVRGTGRLTGIEADMADCSDTAQTLAAVAVFADTPTRVTGIGFIRGKETNRIEAVVTELRRLGIDATEEADGFVVHPGNPQAGSVTTYSDHRMAMSFAVLGLRVPGIAIEDSACVAKTFPDFFGVLDSLRA